MGKAVGRQIFLDGNFVFITFLPAVIIGLPALCLALTGCVCTFNPGFPFLFTAVSAPGLLVLADHSELLVSCWALQGLSREPRDPNTNPCKISLSSPILGTTCVLLSFCLQLRQKGMGNAKENSFPLPSKMSATEFTL